MIHYKQYSFDKNQLNNGSIERRVMGNKEINKKIKVCKEKINSKSTNKIISDIEKLKRRMASLEARHSRFYPAKKDEI